jgi:hypothetical protein
MWHNFTHIYPVLIDLFIELDITKRHTCKNNIEQSQGVRRHIFSGFSRKENRFVYFLLIQLNGIFSIFKREVIQLSNFVFNPYGISWTLWSQYMHTNIVNNNCIKKSVQVLLFFPKKNSMIMIFFLFCYGVLMIFCFYLKNHN